MSAPDTFPRKTDGARWLAMTEAELLARTWIDPDAGRVPLSDYADAGVSPGTTAKAYRLLKAILATGP